MPPAILHTLLRKTPSLAPISHRALLSISGSQSTEFLNGLLASSVRKPLQNQFSSILHAQGRIMYDVFLYATNDGYILEYDSRSSEAPPLLAYLKRHVLRSKVKIRDISEELDVWSAWGSAKDSEWETQRKWQWGQGGAVEPVWTHSNDWPWGSQNLVLFDRRAVGMGNRLLVRKGDSPEQAATHDTLPTEEYLLHRILHGVPEGIDDMPPMQAFPMDSNLDMMGALDFRKGCYVGQELTVRTYHTGVIRKRIFPVTIQKQHAMELLSPSSQEIPKHNDIKVINTGGSRQGPRPRGTGKMLSSYGGVGLALLRLEHVASSEAGDLNFELEMPDGEKLSISPWRPEWWPTEPAASVVESNTE